MKIKPKSNASDPFNLGADPDPDPLQDPDPPPFHVKLCWGYFQISAEFGKIING